MGNAERRACLSGRRPRRARRPSRRARRAAFRIGALAVLGACTPVTTRPPFRPLPEAATRVIGAPPARVIGEISAWVTAESLRVERASPRDGYLETAWYDTATKASIGGSRDVPRLESTVKLRCWADPDVPGKTRLAVEVVYRPRYDPSRPPRDLETPVPDDHAGGLLARKLLDALVQKLGGQEP